MRTVPNSTCYLTSLLFHLWTRQRDKRCVSRLRAMACVRRRAVISGNFISSGRQRLAWLLGWHRDSKPLGWGRRGKRHALLDASHEKCRLLWLRFLAHRDRHYCYYFPLWTRGKLMMEIFPRSTTLLQGRQGRGTIRFRVENRRWKYFSFSNLIWTFHFFFESIKFWRR